MIDGVCGGIAEHFKVDPIWVRLIFAIGGFIFLYVILMLIMEEPDENT